MTQRRTVLVTGANGYIGGAVARAFSRAGWRTFGLLRRSEDVRDLARDEIQPVLGTPEDSSFLDRIGDVTFDVVVSNTEDHSNQQGHLAKVGALIEEVGHRSARAGIRPLIMFSSGCKDYGMMADVHGDPGHAPHVETSPIAPPDFLAARAAFGASLLAARHPLYDATVLRPTNVYGRASSQYGLLFDLAAESRAVLHLYADPNAIMHALHVDDCADGYVALAAHARDAVAGEAFNLSNARYETAKSIGEALARAYGLELAFEPAPADISLWSAHGLANFSQWVSSDKLRALTGWLEHRPTFSEGIEQYRIAYEAAARLQQGADDDRSPVP
jgi:nucleoside-diphosphate-sugar epimerase